jgi:hypothetical protein
VFRNDEGGNDLAEPPAATRGGITYLVFDKNSGELLKVGETQHSGAKDSRWGEYGSTYIVQETEAWKTTRGGWIDRELLIRYVYNRDPKDLEQEWRREIERQEIALMPWDYRDRGYGNVKYRFMMNQKPREFGARGRRAPSLHDPEVGRGFSEWYKKAP